MIRVFYSFPHKIGAGGVCYAAWEHVEALRKAGAEVTVCAGVIHKKFSDGIHVKRTLSHGRFRIPYRLFGRLCSCKIHDWLAARWLRKKGKNFDIVHCFALGSLQTMRVAKELGIPTVLERCNAHTRYAYEVVRNECEELGLKMPRGSSHKFNAAQLKREEIEYQVADYLFCPSEFVAQTFIDQGFVPDKIERFQYGYKPSLSSRPIKAKRSDGLTVLFAAACTPRKGLHYALNAWLSSTACKTGKFLIAGEFIPGYAECLAEKLSHQSVSRLGFRRDLSDVMQNCDVLILPSIEEGSALVSYDARGAGCLLLASESSGAICEHDVNALVHRAGDVQALSEHLSRLDGNRGLLTKLRNRSNETIDELTWHAAGRKMFESYKRMVARHHSLAN
jgi:glycosyltransferase involved in cell wall biosynthesis